LVFLTTPDRYFGLDQIFLTRFIMPERLIFVEPFFLVASVDIYWNLFINICKKSYFSGLNLSTFEELVSDEICQLFSFSS
jgi:hypothetical protein